MQPPVPRPPGPRTVEQALWDLFAGIYLQAVAEGVAPTTDTWNYIVDRLLPDEEPEW